jgi:hypothetical protein
MNPTAMVIAGLILVPVVGLATWAWFAMAQVDEDLGSLSRFEGMSFEI